MKFWSCKISILLRPFETKNPPVSSYLLALGPLAKDNQPYENE